jgi:hypothetical protein
MNKDMQSLEEYETPSGVVLDMTKHYLQELRKAAALNDSKRHQVVVACIAVLDPNSYKQFINKKRRKEK